MKITMYRLLTCTTPGELSEAVSVWIDAGWQPHGSPFSTILDPNNFLDNSTFSQAMVRYE